MQSLEAGKFAAILDEMHTPPDSTEAQIHEDRRAIAVALQFLSSRFGKLESYELALEPVDCVCMSIAMGSEEYWANVAQADPGAVVAYASRYAKIPSAIVRITEMSGGGNWIRSIEIGIPATVPGAKDQVARIARDMVSRMQAVTRKPKNEEAPAAEPD